MDNPDKKFDLILNQIQDEYDDEDYNCLVRQILPHEGEDLLDCLVRTRNTISEHIFEVAMHRVDKTVERLDRTIGDRGTIVPMILPLGISNILDSIKGCMYRNNDMPHVSDMHVATSAIVNGSALLLSDVIPGECDADGDPAFSNTVLDAIDHIRINRGKIFRYSIKNPDYRAIDTGMESPISQVLDDTVLGLRMHRQTVTHPIDNDFEIWMRYQDIGVMEIRNILEIDCGTFSHDVLPIVRYYMELHEDFDKNHIFPGLPLYEMIDFIDHFKAILRYQAHYSDKIVETIEQDDKQSDNLQ